MRRDNEMLRRREAEGGAALEAALSDLAGERERREAAEKALAFAEKAAAKSDGEARLLHTRAQGSSPR